MKAFINNIEFQVTVRHGTVGNVIERFISSPVGVQVNPPPHESAFQEWQKHFQRQVLNECGIAIELPQLIEALSEERVSIVAGSPIRSEELDRLINFCRGYLAAFED